ncbi:alpha-N-arabinofuranosidase [Actinoplanes lobatus]|uniref:non-reducing end alpha-L-arabinofuranosidase n=1 Tax=Actinoplanes lobatus TaxID=113568 RepID=A0A7W7HH21_9ACTN|nr:alpha-L-arabinofuranosidase C-terminal domain-containing protein [Actinoplanes lobatus]MBB4749977.1 alpha-N-arabinofuranosidase [Actinoplanes lobatus]GGN74608.1 alpha-N-arabinofuranosidase [Actinoplanes lobatus]GIE39134.1 alpha-N-arabinofuranosidase [Actinoplanes lobatus]
MTIEAVINVDLDGPKINRHVYGHFAEHLGRCVYGGFYVGEDSSVPNEGGIRLDVVEALRELDIPNLRWPGGCFADEYHWRDGIGPRPGRPTMVNTHWGGVEENNHFGTHEFMALCELLGAEPYISGNVGSGTVREMSEWVDYLTRDGDSPMARLRKANGREQPWKVRFWGLGNEAWGCGGNMTAVQYAAEALRYGTYCRGNDLYKIAAGANAFDFAWTETLMKQVGHLGCRRVTSTAYHALSVHYYTITGPSWDEKGSATAFDTGEYYRTMVSAARVEELLAGHAAVMDCYDPNRNVGLVLDEWGTWFDVEPGTNPGFLHQQNTLRDALVASVHFDVFHRYADRLVMANIAQTVNVLQAMILTDPDSHAMVLTPTYHVFRMNRGHQDATSLRVDLRGPLPSRPVGDATLTTVSMSASRRDGRLLVSLSNLDADSPADVEIDLRGGTVHELGALILTAAAPGDHNTPRSPSTVAPRPYDGVSVAGGRLRAHLPPHSFVTVSGTL